MRQWISIAIPLSLALAGCASQQPEPCQPLKSAYPHTSLEQSVLADELPKDGPTSQAWISEYVALRASGATVCEAK